MTCRYKEILRLKKMLENEHVQFEYHKQWNGGHIHSVDFAKNSFGDGWSVIEHDGSYGREKDLLEISFGLMTEEERREEDDDVLGYLTAEQVFARILDFENREEA